MNNIENMTSDTTIKHWLEDLFKSIDEKNSDNFCRHLAEDVHFRFGNMPITLGKTAVCDQIRYFFDSIKSLRHQVTESWSHNDSVVCHGTVHYTRHDDTTLNVPFSNILKLKNNKASEYLIFVDISKLY